MLITIEQLRHRVQTDCDKLIAELQALTGRYGAEEAKAWRNSLGQLSGVFSKSSFQPLHLYFGSRGSLALEYQLPASSSWCDVVLLGAHKDEAAAVIIELKDWTTRADKAGRAEGLIERQGSQELHPSDQVRGYTEYCRRFHSAVEDHSAKVHGCVLFTKDPWAPEYAVPPNENLAAQFPLFTLAAHDIDERLPAFFAERLTAPSESFARAFSEGRYRQDRGFVSQIAQQILEPRSAVFELLDDQRKAFAFSRAIVEDAFINSGSAVPPKRVVIIKGPPGSGKSVIAAKLWASLVTNLKMPQGDIVFATTSQSQNSNWAEVFDRATGIDGAQGVIRKATSFTPISTQEQGRLRNTHGREFLADATIWRENLAILKNLGVKTRDGAWDDQNLVTIVDEAHALINPEHASGRGQFGFVGSLGPQAYHIIRSSLLTVFLLDPLQGYRERENTTIEDIRKWSEELGAGTPEEISLDDTQFRCGGSREYVAWIESLLGGATVEVNRNLAALWRKASGPAIEPNKVIRFPVQVYEPPVKRAAEDTPIFGSKSSPVRPGMDFRIFSEPESWEGELDRRHKEGNSVRLLSSFSRPWKTGDSANPHSLPQAMKDFHEPYLIDGEERRWSRVWNFVPRGTNYTWFVTGHAGGRIAHDPLCEVGCPYAVRGFDFDYVGILWLDDLRWNGGAWQVEPQKVKETGIGNLTRRARIEIEEGKPGAALSELGERVAQAYRILFTRALKGVYVWVPDQQTRLHIAESMGCVENG